MRWIVTLIGALAVANAGCARETPPTRSPRAPQQPARTHAPASDGDTTKLTARQLGDVVPYDCRGFAAAPPAGGSCRAAHPQVAAMIEAAHALVRKMARHHFAGKPDLWSEPRARMAALSTLRPAALHVMERVAAQSAVLIVAVKALWSGNTAVARAAARLLARLALSAEALGKLPARPETQLRRFIGAPSGWRELRTPTQGLAADATLHHETFFAYALAFRPVRAGERRALFGQLVAIDRSFTPHVTGIVETLEMRRGLALRAPACVAAIDLSRLACDAPALRVAATPRDIPAHPFVTVVHDKVLCASCHPRNAKGGFNLAPVAADAATQAAMRARRHANLMRELRKVSAKLRALAR
ncbi:MAG: hypothetical protein KC503_25925 [Myxococcales bacterium]|nr:hypothetical protein [Myxococcales bacterium]